MASPCGFAAHLHGFAGGWLHRPRPGRRAGRRDGRKSESQKVVVCRLFVRAANGSRTRDLELGKLALYQLSYRRTIQILGGPLYPWWP